MATLASIDDYEALTGSLETPDVARVRRLLELASDAVLARAHGQNIISQEYEDVVLYNHDGRFWFPQRPVTNVASVVVDGETIDPSSYRFTSGGDGRPALLIRRCEGRDVSWHCPEATATFTAGWDPIHGQLVASVVATAHGAYNSSDATTQTVTPEGQAISSFPSVSLAALTMKLQPSVCKVIDDLTKVDGPASVELGRG